MLDVSFKALLVFKSIYETGCCSYVSKRYSISSSKVSRYLSVMRLHYKDSLFIRKKSGFIPTEKSKLIYPKICEIIDLYYDIDISEPSSHSECEYIIAVPPTLSVGLPEYIDDELTLISKQATVNIKPLRDGVCDDIIQGSVSLAIIQDESKEVRECLNKHKDVLISKPVGVGQFVYLVAGDKHPIWHSEINLENIATYPFVVTAISGFNDKVDPFSVYCCEHGLDLRVVHKTHSLAGLINKLKLSDSISFIGTQCAVDFISMIRGIKVLKLPHTEYIRLHSMANRPSYSLVYHQALEHDFPVGFMTSLSHFILGQISDS